MRTSKKGIHDKCIEYTNNKKISRAQLNRAIHNMKKIQITSFHIKECGIGAMKLSMTPHN